MLGRNPKIKFLTKIFKFNIKTSSVINNKAVLSLHKIVCSKLMSAKITGDWCF